MGSRYFLARGPVSREKIVADINMAKIARLVYEITMKPEIADRKMSSRAKRGDLNDL